VSFLDYVSRFLPYAALLAIVIYAAGGLFFAVSWLRHLRRSS